MGYFSDLVAAATPMVRNAGAVALNSLGERVGVALPTGSEDRILTTLAPPGPVAVPASAGMVSEDAPQAQMNATSRFIAYVRTPAGMAVVAGVVVTAWMLMRRKG